MTKLSTVQTARKVQMIANQLQVNELYNDFKSEYFVGMAESGKALPASTDAVVNIIQFKDGTQLKVRNINAQTLLVPAPSNSGLNIAGDQTATDGWELSPTYAGNTNDPFVFTVGTDAPFYIKGTLNVADVSGTAECLFGFRKNAAFQAALSSYTDYAVMNLNAGNVYTQTRLNTGTASDVDSTVNVADGVSVTFEIRVNQFGVVEFLVDGETPTVDQDFTFDDGDVVIPFFRLIQDTDLTGDVFLSNVEIGYLD